MPKPLQILLAEDNHADVLYTKMVLEKSGIPHSLEIVSDGEKALEVLFEALKKNKLPDILFLDIKMPKFNGLEILEKIRSMPELVNLPVVVVTGSDDPGDLQKTKTLEASYVKKPPDLEKLWQLLSVFEQANSSVRSKKHISVKVPRKKSLGTNTNERQPTQAKSRICRVLIVEDSPLDARLLQSSLQRASGNTEFILEMVQSLVSAEKIIESGEFDVVALDLGLPDSSGLEGYLNLQNKFPNMPFIIVTGNDDEELAKTAVAQGAQDYITKGGASYGDILSRSLQYAIERKRSESLAKEALFHQHEILRHALEKAPMCVIRFDSEFKILDTNKSASECMKLKDENFQGKFLFDVIPALQSFQLSRIFDTTEPFHMHMLAIPQILSNTHTDLFWDVMAWPILSKNDTPTEAVLLIMDVSEKVRHSKQRDMFVQVLAHDIKNPLLGEQSILRTVLGQAPEQISPPFVKECLNGIWKSNDALILMLTNLIEAYKFENDLYTPNMEPLDVLESLAECMIDLKSQFFLNQKTLITENSSTNSMILGDRIAVRRLLLNVLHNAIKYTPNDGAITLKTENVANDFVITVSDSGPGMTSIEKQNLFKPLAMATSGKQYWNSSGLGLFISKELVNALHGNINVESATGQGTKVVISLPLLDSKNSAKI